MAAEDEKSWVETAMNSTGPQLEKIVRNCRRANRIDELEQERARHRARSPNTYLDNDGMLGVEGRLLPEARALVSKALEAAYLQLRAELQGSAGDDAAKADFRRLRADALERLAEQVFGNAIGNGDGHGDEHGNRDSNGTPKSSADHRQVVVHVDAETLVDPSAGGRSDIEDGAVVSAVVSPVPL